MTNIGNILTLIPQKPPFVMVDELLYADDNIGRTKFTVKKDTVLVENGLFSESGMVENIAQTAAAQAGYMAKKANTPVLNGYIGAVKNLEIFSLPEISDILETEITLENKIFDATLISGKITCNGALLAQCQMKVFVVNQE